MPLSTTFALVAFVSSAWAQLNMARCPAGFDWNRNPLGQDPCTVGSMLDASCRGLSEYAYPPLVDSNEYYLPPRANRSGDVMCHCNTVMYSLYMACASCQGGQIYSWTKWIPECASIYVSQYPANIPEGTVIPSWAYNDIMSLPNQTWSDFAMISTVRRRSEVFPRQVTSSPPTSEPSTSPPESTPSGTLITTPYPPKMTIIKTPSGPSAPPASPDPVTPTTTYPPNSPDPVPPTTTNSPNSPDPSIPTDTTSPTGNTNLPVLTTSSKSGSLPRPSNNTSSTRPANSVTTGANPLRPTNAPGSNTNAGSTKSGTNFWAIAILLLCTLI